MKFFPSSAEQVTRILSGMKMIPNFWCRVNLHSWTRWEVLKSQRYNNTNRLYEELRSECKYCGLPRFIEIKCAPAKTLT
jgi:hypothetical protein